MSNNIPDILRHTIWKNMLNAHYNYFYFDTVQTNYSLYNRYVKIFLAISSSTTVASWILWENFDILWKILSSASAVVAIIVGFLKWDELIKASIELGVSWYKIYIGYEKLWRLTETNQLSTKKTNSVLDELSIEKTKIIHLETIIPNSNKIDEISREKVLINLLQSEQGESNE